MVKRGTVTDDLQSTKSDGCIEKADKVIPYKDTLFLIPLDGYWPD